MTLVELRCPSCTAPVDASGADRTVCRYCGATLVAKQPAASRTEDRFFVVLRVGPSNVGRIAGFLERRLSLPAEAARAKASSSPVELALGADRNLAEDIVRGAIESGAAAELVTRVVTIPIVRVVLDDAGPNRLAVIVALRAHVELPVYDAKQLVEATPSLVAPALDEPKARALVTALEAAGASARIE